MVSRTLSHPVFLCALDFNHTGGGRQTLASHKLILDRHDEILNLVLTQSQSFAKQSDMTDFMRQANERAEERDAELEVVLARLNKHGEILDEHGRILGEHGDRLNEHDDRLNQHDGQHAAQQRWNKRAEKEMRKLAKQLSQEHLGQSDPGAQQNQSEVVEILDSDDDDDDEVQDLQAPGSLLSIAWSPGSLLSMDLTQEQLDAFAAALATDKLGFVRAPFIRGEDFATLTLGAWLNDCVITDFFGLLKARGETLPLRCHCFSSHFFFKIMEQGQRFNYESVSSWSDMTSSPWTTFLFRATSRIFTGLCLWLM